ncbi:MAG TPA: hypothetical protein VF669_05595 [Tepidisphaeraceae bacterium]|jgi:hypothetical protein
MEATLTKPPLSQRINWRMIIFFLVIGTMIGYPLYQFVHEAVTGGITSAGNGYTHVELKAMSGFVFDQTAGSINDIPEKWRQLDGKKVIMEGEMWDSRGAGQEVSSFQLCYSIAKCCFSGPPQVQHFVNSRPMEGKSLNYYSGLVRVKGVLHVNVKKEAGKVQSVFEMDVESVEPF